MMTTLVHFLHFEETTAVYKIIFPTNLSAESNYTLLSIHKFGYKSHNTIKDYHHQCWMVGMNVVPNTPDVLVESLQRANRSSRNINLIIFHSLI